MSHAYVIMSERDLIRTLLARELLAILGVKLPHIHKELAAELIYAQFAPASRAALQA